jgi:hypothetical protein
MSIPRSAMLEVEIDGRRVFVEDETPKACLLGAHVVTVQVVDVRS